MRPGAAPLTRALLRARATVELDARLPICEIADLIEGVMQPLHSQKRAKVQP